MKVKALIHNIEVSKYISLSEIKRTFLTLYPYIYTHRKAYMGMFFIMFIDIGLAVGYAWFFGNIMDAAVEADFDRLKFLLVVGISLTLLSIITNYIDIYLETIAINGVKRDLNIDLYKKVLILSGKDTSEIHSGEMLSYFTNDLDYVDGLIGRGLLNLVRFPIISIAAFIYLVNISWSLSLFSLILSPIAVVGGAVFGFLLRNNNRKVLSLISNINKNLNDTFNGLQVIRSFTLEKIFHNKYSSYQQELYLLDLKDAKLRGWFYTGGAAVGSITFLTSLVLGAYFVSNSVITVGALFTFINLVNYLVSPLTGLAGQWAGYQYSATALERIIDLLEKKTEYSELPSYSPSKLSPISSIRVNNITFSYDGHSNVFENLHFEFPIGKMIALVGPSGAGKSTLVNLLQGLYLPQSGSILLNNQSISDMKVSELRSSIAYVPQETFLFSGTLRENLELAKPNISELDMIQACKAANIHEFIQSLPKGYNTEIGERGIRLSGGQKQRVAIARALLKDAPILLLDEATSALDNETEYRVKEALNLVVEDRTTIVIAHRLSTIQQADLIVVMDEGKIVQSGTHDELIHRPGLYQQLHRSLSYNQVEEELLIL
ncbi:ABC transporter ATP-binding protein [Bacillus sp. AK128]